MKTIEEILDLINACQDQWILNDGYNTPTGAAGQCFYACRNLSLFLKENNIDSTVYRFLGAPEYLGIAERWKDRERREIQHHILSIPTASGIFFVDVTRRQFEPEADSPAIYATLEACAAGWTSVTQFRYKPPVKRHQTNRFITNAHTLEERTFRRDYARFICDGGPEPTPGNWHDTHSTKVVIWETVTFDDGEAIPIR